MKRIVIFGIACLVLVLGFLLASRLFEERRAGQLGSLAAEDASVFVRDHSPRLGPEDAKVHLVEFTDPACETCAAFSPIVQRIMSFHPGRIQLVIRWAPFHEGSAGAVRLLEAARMQDKFWPTLHYLYRNQGLWTRNHRVELGPLWQHLPEIGLDVERLQRDMNDPRITAIIEQDLADAETLGVRRTPGFFVNGEPLEPFGIEPLSALVEEKVQEEY